MIYRHYVKRKDKKLNLDNQEFEKSQYHDTTGFDYDDLPEKPPSSKPVRIIKRVFKIFFISLLVAMWGVIFTVIILRSNHDILDTPILSDNARQIYKADKDNFIIYRVYPSEFMTADGSLQLDMAVYAEKAGEFEIGVRIAWTQLRYCEECDAIYTPVQLERQIKDDKIKADLDENYSPTACQTIHHLKRASETGGSIRYTITDSEGNTYAQSNRVSRTKSLNFGIINIKYEYERVAFTGLYFDLENNIINRMLNSRPENSTSSSRDELSDDDDVDMGVSYYLNIYDEHSGHLLFSSCIYDNNTYIAETKYKEPDKDYLK